MRATTVKVDGDLLRELERNKPSGETLTGYVRAILQREMQRVRMEAAAVRYSEFLRDAPDERAWLGAWDDADLSRPPTRKRT